MDTPPEKTILHRTPRRSFSLCEREINILGVTLLLLLSFAGSIIAYANHQSVPQKDLRPTRQVSKWRRTNQGWEKSSAWFTTLPKKYSPQLHPGVIAGTMVFLSLMGLIAFPAKVERGGSASLQVSPIQKKKLARPLKFYH